MARLSIIVTSYNIESYLGECLDGIVGQTLDDLEIIVVDDGSTDGSPDIIRDYAARDDRIVPVLLEENTIGGVASAANAGLDVATATWVGFADGDDLYDPRMFELLVSAAEREETDLAMCQYELLDDADASTAEPADHGRWRPLLGTQVEFDVQTRKQVLQFVAVPWRKVYRRSMLEDHGIRFPVGDYFWEDNPFHWFSVLSSNGVALVPEVLCQHRVARIGQTMATVDQRLVRMFDHHDTILTWLEARGLSHEYGGTLLAWSLSQMEWISRRTPKPLRRDLFDRLRRVLDQHDDVALKDALAQKGNPVTASRLAAAIRADNFATFVRTLDHPNGSTSPLVSAAYHLRHSGPRRVAELGARYVYRESRRMARQLVRQARSRRRGVVRSSHARSLDGDSKITNEDLILSMMVLERRLTDVQDRLEAMSTDDSASVGDDSE